MVNAESLWNISCNLERISFDDRFQLSAANYPWLGHYALHQNVRRTATSGLSAQFVFDFQLVHRAYKLLRQPLHKGTTSGPFNRAMLHEDVSFEQRRRTALDGRTMSENRLESSLGIRRRYMLIE
ncbi:hypothetical protein KIN20_020174 [Parelaphostrongylus tenuis]|uniref:Uncharacterized protein n=1 Tax=Parelaphostrongylus tenuis TaxID=148309 RepID=A0AAD5MM68_PARTN|nr:hypothetical protein KIN20_020174 [Parelaphostrongylus tenuis]